MLDADLVRGYMHRHRLDQARLAAAAGVSQATVSRALTGAPLRRGRAYRKLLAYIENKIAPTPKPSRGKRQVAKAFEEIWDGSDIHAAVIAQIIHDLAGLRPSQELRKRLGGQKRTSA